MGGTGSTRWRGHQRRRLVEEVPALRLDRTLRHCHKRVLQAAPATQAYTLTWYRGERPIATCEISVERLADGVSHMRLTYDAGTERITEAVMFELRPQRLGGQRAWWCCPGCGRRCAVLYQPTGAMWRCRTCADLTYRSSVASDQRISQALASPDLVAALDALMLGTTVGDLILKQKLYERIERRMDRARRGGFCRT